MMNNESMIYQMNMQHSKMATTLLSNDILGAEAHPVIALIQEPYLGARGVPMGVSRDLMCYCGGKGARAAIFSKGIDLLFCPTFSGRDVVVCQLKRGEKNIFMVSAYFDINKSIPEDLVKFLDNGLTAEDDVIIGCDTNAHSTLWGSSETNRRGEMMEDLIFKYNLSIRNRGVTPTFVNQRASSVIDLTLCSRNIFESIHGWKVNKEELYSDHRRIEFNLRGVVGIKKPEQWALKRANWKVFQEMMKVKSEKFKPHRYWTPITLDAESKRLTLDIRACLKTACERSKPKKRWWSKDLETQRRRVRGLHKLVLKDRPNDVSGIPTKPKETGSSPWFKKRKGNHGKSSLLTPRM